MTINKRVQKYIALALEESTKSDYERINIGAVIADGNYLVSKGYNSRKSHPIQAKLNSLSMRTCTGSCLHAEVASLVNARSYDLRGCELFVARFMRSGKLGMCKPCCACERGLRAAGISKCYYTTEDGVKLIEF